MQSGFVNICNIPTHVFTTGRWIEEPLENTKEIVICISGNPGLPGFYEEFGTELFRQLKGRMPVWVIGHAGHDDPSTSDIEVPELKGNETIYNLNGQIRHKIEFIQKYVPFDVKIHLIGHSIGAWMILQMLTEEGIRQRIKCCYLLFPTFERMAESPNGFIFTKIVVPSYTLLSFLIILLNLLPRFLCAFLIRLYFWFSSIPNGCTDTVLRYLKPSVIEKVVFLAKDEMASVCGRPDDIIASNLSLLKFYYGTTDGWVPVQYFKDLKERFAEADASLDTQKISHAFVLRSSQEMACIVNDMITG